MKIKLAVSAFFALLSCTSFCQKDYPTYKEIVNTFFSEYDLPEDQNFASSIRFSKNIDGYYIEEYNWDKGSYGNGQLFWSSENGKYSKINFPKGKVNEEDMINSYLTDGNAFNYYLNPYYGYIGWEYDVISFFENKKNLSDSDLYALGRAYSNFASNLVCNNSGFADSSKMYKIKEYGSSQLSTDELKEYKFYQNKAIETYNYLCTKNPGFETIVGSICTKYCNEYLTEYLDLSIYQNEAEAKKVLPDSIYSGFYLDMARNYLNSCDSNAILFTNGDNDTYPILYLQAKNSFRQDVLIVNLSLLNSANYINHFRYGKTLRADSLSMILSPESYSGNKLGWAFIKKNSAENGYISLTEALNFIENQDPLTDNLSYPDWRYLISDKLELAIDSIKHIHFNITERALSKGDVVALDIMQSNISDRPVYFIYTNNLGLQDNLELNGFAYKLVSNICHTDQYQFFGGVNSKKTFNQITNNFNLNSVSEYNSQSEGIVLRGYQLSFCRLALYYSDLKMKDSCKRVIDYYRKIMPNEIYQMDYSLLPMIEAAYNCNLIDEGNSITSKIIENIEFQISSSPLDEDDKNKIRYTTRELEKLIPNNKALNDRIDKINSIM